MKRYAARVDANQSLIVEALRAAGAVVDIIGLPVDLRIAYVDSGGAKRFAYFECKDGAKSASRIKKTDVQEAFFAKYPGWPVCLVDSPEVALKHLKVLKS